MTAAAAAPWPRCEQPVASCLGKLLNSSSGVTYNRGLLFVCGRRVAACGCQSVSQRQRGAGKHGGGRGQQERTLRLPAASKSDTLPTVGHMCML